MKLRQPSLWDDHRIGFEESITLTAQSVLAFAGTHKHWVIAYSGGKDSSALVTVIVYLIITGRIPAPESLTVLYADTRLELPPLHASAMAMFDALRQRGIRCEVVYPALDDRFFVYMFGRGVPPPSNTFRWCTPQLKVEPMLAAVKGLRDRVGEKLLMLTGVRLGESAARDARIALSCGRNGAECGQGWFQETTPDSIADTLAPLLHWRVCFVWDWLKVFAPAEGFPTQLVADSYGGDEAEEANTRTGCMQCNLTESDVAFDYVLKMPRWGYIAPIRRLRPLYRWLKLPANRLRQWDERKADGSLVKNPGRMGPLTMDARLSGLQAVLDIQAECNAARGDMPAIDLINAEEEARIRQLIASNQWPNGWTGEEMRADTVVDDIRRDGSIQKVMFDILEGADQRPAA